MRQAGSNRITSTHVDEKFQRESVLLISGGDRTKKKHKRNLLENCKGRAGPLLGQTMEAWVLLRISHCRRLET